MHEQKKEYEKIFSKIKIRYIISVIIMFAFAMINYFNMQYHEFKYKFWVEVILLVSACMVIVFQIIFIFRFSEKFFRRACREKERDFQNIVKLFHALNGVHFLVEEQTLQIIMMNQGAEELISNREGSYIGKGIEQLVDFEAIDGCPVIDRIIAENRICNLEIKVQENNENVSRFLLSTVKGKYRGNCVILISLFDETMRKKAEETLKRLAIRDELTGVYNRHFMESMIEEEMERSLRYDYPISILIFDLDYFKRINDTWGHPVGDMVLKQTTELVSQISRKSDYLIRIGGEEFLLIMPHTNIEGAITMADKIRVEIEEYTHPIVGKYTVSIGVTQRRKTESFQTIYERADAAMYQAKNEGRNRVVSIKNQAEMPIASINFKWKSEWESGIAEIDEPHKELLNLANSLMYISLSNKGDEKAKQMISILEEKIVNHFKSEEKILRKLEVPNYQEHVNMHQYLVDKFIKLNNSYENGEIKPSLFFMFVVDEVVVNHLVEMDTKFFPYLKKK
jgi:diguanylate cyclase (GGDEF)-like protein/hemerythrin-like metal-binding protein